MLPETKNKVPGLIEEIGPDEKGEESELSLAG